MERQELFEEVCSHDFLKFKFGGRGYQDQLYDSIAKTGCLAGVKVELITFELPTGSPFKIVWVAHNFAFLGGSLGCAEGEKITRAFEYSTEHSLPIVVQCRTGGARMQEGTSSLMQMAKVSVAVDAHRRAGLPFISILSDPTYGGVSASYAMQADIRIAVSDARIGFAGPAVILNTMCEANQSRFDKECPPDFQSASYVYQHGQIDMVLDTSSFSSATEIQSSVESTALHISSLLCSPSARAGFANVDISSWGSFPVGEEDKQAPFDYTRSRQIDRPQCQDLIQQLFPDFVELSGDGRVGRDPCIRGGLASFQGRTVIALATYKGHTPATMQAANYGMASPHGYRTAHRLMQLAQQFHFPVITLVDTVGAWPTFDCEQSGQSEAIATNLTCMAGLEVPILTLVVGEGGSGGALGIAMGNRIAMLSGAYFGVISPEGAASILGRYRNDQEKAVQFPLDCQELATAQWIYAHQLQKLGVVDEILWESIASQETFQDFPVLRARVAAWLLENLQQLEKLSGQELVEHRYRKFRAIGSYEVLKTEEERRQAVADAVARKSGGRNRPAAAPPATCLIRHLAEETVTGSMSKYRTLTNVSSTAVNCEEPQEWIRDLQLVYPVPSDSVVASKSSCMTAKHVLDQQGPQALAEWVRSHSSSRVFLTDTTLRDAHQSLLATRVRSRDIIRGAQLAQQQFLSGSNDISSMFSLECWGGATFDVCMRFLDECPWERLRQLRRSCPDLCLQMLIRGANAVGYTSYPDNVVTEFIRLAALEGMDIFRIFDCFNVVENMKVAIDAVRASGKVAEVCVCYTGNLMTSTIYNLEYYQSVVKECVEAGAHMIGIKDMAGLMRPHEVQPLLAAIREVTSLPIHFHTHATSSGSLATCLEMARWGCDVIDFCTASMADGTSQPSLNTFLAMMEGSPRSPGLNYMDLETYDMYWSRIRSLYAPFESGMLSGTARVFDHQIPGGQYSNLLVQCQSMGLWSRWEEVLDAYRDVNLLFGDIVKVTPSSKCVGDLALYLVTRHITAKDLLDPAKASSIDWPDSVVGLLKGELGFPHRGFPADVESAILKGQSKLTIRAGLVLPPVNFEENRRQLESKFNIPITEVMAMSSLMYPKVFSDYITRMKNKSHLLTYLPTPVYFYAMKPGQSFTVTIPKEFAGEVLVPSQVAGLADKEFCDVTVLLTRVGPLKDRRRMVSFTVNGQAQDVDVVDNTGVFVFEGPMAKSGDDTNIASPMPGLIEKLLVKEGQRVQAGEILCTVSAMKMEVKVTAPYDAVVSSLLCEIGTRVIEGALLFVLSKQ